MRFLRTAAILVLIAASERAPAAGGGLDAAGAVGRFLNGALPSSTPRFTGGYRIVEAFPQLTFGEPLHMQPVPRSTELIVVEKEGRLVAFEDHPDTYMKRVVLDIRGQVESTLDSGMLGLAFHPDFGDAASPNRDYLYVYYRYTPDPTESDKAYLRLSRFTWDPATGTAAAGSEFVLINQYDRNNWHSGGGLLFGPDGFLYLSIGDEGGVNDFYDATQKLDAGFFSGVLRIDVDQDGTKSHPVRRQPRSDEAPPEGWPPTFSQGYFIPNDNPWISEDGSTLEEFFAIGLRNPHRMTLDPATGDLWVGDVGQSTEEEVSRIVRGGNYQWPFREGDATGPKATPIEIQGFEVPPVHTYGRGSGTCIIGGYVYRGALLPELNGKYLFGDLGSEQVWSLDPDGGNVVVENILNLASEPYLPDFSMSSFGIDAGGELYLIFLGGRGYNDGRIYRIERSTVGTPEPPSLLSETNAFTDLASLTPSAGVIPYDVNQPLWSDAAEKKRWIAIPNDGNPDSDAEQIIWSEDGNWDFPVGTVLIKHFEFPGRRLETRFMARGEDGVWFGFTYRWREDGSDAELLASEPLEENVVTDGVTRTWHFPGRNECASCHNEKAGRVLGVKTSQLNRDFFYETTGRSANQLVTLNRLGFFAGGIDESILGEVLTARHQSNQAATLERRARSYLDANCAHCHQPGTSARANFDARLSTAPWAQNLISAEPLNDFGITGASLVAPGHPELSTLLLRVGSTEAGVAMPPVAKHLVDAAGMELLTEWIRSLDPETGPIETASPRDTTAPRFVMQQTGAIDPLDGGFTLSLTASEDILGLSASDFNVGNASVSDLTGSGRLWSLRFTPEQPGDGSIFLSGDRVTDRSGNANAAAGFSFEADDSRNGRFFSEGMLDQLRNGDFESGLASWDTGGSVSLGSPAPGGSAAAVLEAGSFVVQTYQTTPGESISVQGTVRNASPGGRLEVGFSFWNASGGWIADHTRILAESIGDTRFLVRATVPEGSVTLTVWAWRSEGSAIMIDDLRMFSPPDEPPEVNLLTNGDFETGALEPWDTGGSEVALIPHSEGGQFAAHLGSNAFLVQSRSVAPGEIFVFSGKTRNAGPADASPAAGISYWNQAGEWLGDSRLTLPASADYAPFSIDSEAPAGASVCSVWIWSNEGASPDVDDLMLVGQGSVAMPDAAPGAIELASRLTMMRLKSGSTLDLSPGSGYRMAPDLAAGLDSADTVISRGWNLRDGSLQAVSDSGSPQSVVTTVNGPGTLVLGWLLAGAEAGSGLILQIDGVLRSVSKSSGRPTMIAIPVEGRGLHTVELRLTGVENSDATARVDSFAMLPLAPEAAPDLSIGQRSGNLLGSGYREPRGLVQTLRLTRFRRGGVISRMNWTNLSEAHSDAADLALSGSLRGVRVDAREAGPAAGNITALLKTGLYQTSVESPGVGRDFSIRLLPTKRRGAVRAMPTLRARSVINPGEVDAVRILVRSR